MSTKKLSSLTYSILDLATVIEGKTAADTFKRSVDVARHAEEWGYERYWFAEHHNSDNIGSSATSLLIGYVAENTATIRVGSVVYASQSLAIDYSEQFRTPAHLNPNRID